MIDTPVGLPDAPVLDVHAVDVSTVRFIADLIDEESMTWSGPGRADYLAFSILGSLATRLRSAVA